MQFVLGMFFFFIIIITECIKNTIWLICLGTGSEQPFWSSLIVSDLKEKNGSALQLNENVVKKTLPFNLDMPHINTKGT